MPPAARPWFTFPVNDDGEAARPKARPCVSVDLASIAGERFITLAYGTTSKNRANCGEEMHIRTRHGRACAGLDRPTKFICARRLTIFPDHPGFVAASGGSSPLIGHLDARAMERLHEIRARIHALRDSAAARRSRQQGRRRPMVRGVDFTVESRRPRQRTALPEASR